MTKKDVDRSLSKLKLVCVGVTSCIAGAGLYLQDKTKDWFDPVFLVLDNRDREVVIRNVTEMMEGVNGETIRKNLKIMALEEIVSDIIKGKIQKIRGALIANRGAEYYAWKALFEDVCTTPPIDLQKALTTSSKVVIYLREEGGSSAFSAGSIPLINKLPEINKSIPFQLAITLLPQWEGNNFRNNLPSLFSFQDLNATVDGVIVIDSESIFSALGNIGEEFISLFKNRVLGNVVERFLLPRMEGSAHGVIDVGNHIYFLSGFEMHAKGIRWMIPSVLPEISEENFRNSISLYTHNFLPVNEFVSTCINKGTLSKVLPEYNKVIWALGIIGADPAYMLRLENRVLGFRKYPPKKPKYGDCYIIIPKDPKTREVSDLWPTSPEYGLPKVDSIAEYLGEKGWLYRDPNKNEPVFVESRGRWYMFVTTKKGAYWGPVSKKDLHRNEFKKMTNIGKAKQEIRKQTGVVADYFVSIQPVLISKEHGKIGMCILTYGPIPEFISSVLNIKDDEIEHAAILTPRESRTLKEINPNIDFSADTIQKMIESYRYMTKQVKEEWEVLMNFSKIKDGDSKFQITEGKDVIESGTEEDERIKELEEVMRVIDSVLDDVRGLAQQMEENK